MVTSVRAVARSDTNNTAWLRIPVFQKFRSL
jgi:hypothetical protein